MNGYRFTAQHCTTVNINARQKKITTTEFQKYITNIRINNNVLVVQVTQTS